MVSAVKLAHTEVVSRLLKASSDSVMKKNVIAAILDNDVEFIQVHQNSECTSIVTNQSITDY